MAPTCYSVTARLQGTFVKPGRCDHGEERGDQNGHVLWALMREALPCNPSRASSSTSMPVRGRTPRSNERFGLREAVVRGSELSMWSPSRQRHGVIYERISSRP